MAKEYDLDGNIDPFQDIIEGGTWTHKDFLKHYERNGSFGFNRLIHFHPQQFDNCKTQLNELENRYTYIHENLTDWCGSIWPLACTETEPDCLEGDYEIKTSLDVELTALGECPLQAP